jgi:hypothetical protein
VRYPWAWLESGACISSAIGPLSSEMETHRSNSCMGQVGQFCPSSYLSLVLRLHSPRPSSHQARQSFTGLHLPALAYLRACQFVVCTISVSLDSTDWPPGVTRGAHGGFSMKKRHFVTPSTVPLADAYLYRKLWSDEL